MKCRGDVSQAPRTAAWAVLDQDPWSAILRAPAKLTSVAAKMLDQLKQKIDFVPEQNSTIAVLLLFLAFLALTPKEACSFHVDPPEPAVDAPTD